MTHSNLLYLVVGALLILVGVMSYPLYQDRKRPEGMRINIGPNGFSVDKK